MAEDPEKARLDALEARIQAAKGGDEPPKKAHQDEHYSQAQLAWRMVIELVAGIVIGFGIGFGLDRLLGTGPFLMIVFLGLGFAAGVRTMMRSAAEVQKEQVAKAAEQKETGHGGSE